ncbi:hypothetical protein E5288_WYG008397 [Bos mutus]|uniref:Uncharacterized protein n=1 Tax=Bos mutus TaxID=72004 RepID=A0A6B0RJ77_9CETA|nr:hypothetical protein [Bos mutus]
MLNIVRKTPRVNEQMERQRVPLLPHINISLQNSDVTAFSLLSSVNMMDIPGYRTGNDIDLSEEDKHHVPPQHGILSLEHRTLPYKFLITEDKRTVSKLRLNIIYKELNNLSPTATMHYILVQYQQITGSNIMPLLGYSIVVPHGELASVNGIL